MKTDKKFLGVLASLVILAEIFFVIERVARRGRGRAGGGSVAVAAVRHGNSGFPGLFA